MTIFPNPLPSLPPRPKGRYVRRAQGDWETVCYNCQEPLSALRNWECARCDSLICPACKACQPPYISRELARRREDVSKWPYRATHRLTAYPPVICPFQVSAMGESLWAGIWRDRVFGKYEAGELWDPDRILDELWLVLMYYLDGPWLPPEHAAIRTHCGLHPQMPYP